MEALTKRGITHIEDPVQAHLDIAAKLYSLVEILESQIATLDHITNVDMQGTEAIAAVLSTYQSCLKDTANVLNQVNKLDLLERRFQMEQADIRMVADAVQRGIWSELAGLDYDQATQVQNAVSAEFVRLQQLAA
jgi:regulator of sigma D